MWQYGTYKPVANPWGWHHLTNMVWVEQPIGTGFSTGTVTAENEEDVAEQFMGFFKNFVDTFSMQGYKVYITGESYASVLCYSHLTRLRLTITVASTARTLPAPCLTPRTKHTLTCAA